MAMVAMNMVSTEGFSGVSFHLKRCPQGVASVLCKKTPIFGSRRSKLDHLTVLSFQHEFVFYCWKYNANSMFDT
jgi:hypothetical protein